MHQTVREEAVNSSLPIRFTIFFQLKETTVRIVFNDDYIVPPDGFSRYSGPGVYYTL